MTTENSNNANIALTPTEIRLIQTTWGLASGSIQTIINFYNHLFYNYPDLRTLFNDDICFQAKLFNDTMTEFVQNIENWDEVVPFIIKLGKRHKAYKVQPAHYEILHKWLIQELSKAIPNDWNKETEVAWTKFIQMITKEMLAT